MVVERKKDEGTRSCKFAFRCIRDNVGAPILRAVRQERLKQHGPDPGQEPAAERLGGIKTYKKQFDCLFIFLHFPRAVPVGALPWAACSGRSPGWAEEEEETGRPPGQCRWPASRRTKR